MKINTAVLVGIGGSGSIAVEAMCKILMYHPQGTHAISLYDLDEYEPNNSKRQIFNPEFFGVNKAIATGIRLEGAMPNLLIYPYRIDKDTLTEAIYRHDPGGLFLIISAVDNHESRKCISQTLTAYAQMNDTPDRLEESFNYAFICPGNSDSTCKVSLDLRIEQQNIFPNILDRAPDINRANSDVLPGSCGYEEVSAPQTIVANGMSAMCIWMYVNALLNDLPLYPEMYGDVKKGKIVSNGEPVQFQP